MADNEKKHSHLKNAALWTGWYFVASYLIFLIIFHFNILHAADWAKIPHMTLHGFGGLAFGVAMVAWIPIWLAGCAAVFKTGRPLLSLKKAEEKKNSEEKEEKADEKETEVKFPANLPEEMRVPYARMVLGRLSRGAMDCRVVQKPSCDAALSAECAPAPEAIEMPLPDSFDIDAPSAGADTPVFREITFGSSDSIPDISEPPESDVKIETIGGKKFAIAIHDDSDFWIADSENWFAGGKQKPSPVAAAIAAAESNGAAPVLLLRAENIMDLDALREKWGEDGVRVVKDLSEL